MLYPSHNMGFQRSLRRVLVLACIFMVLDIMLSLQFYNPLRRPHQQQLPVAAAATTLAEQRLGRVFIAANHWNSESVLRSHWVDAVLGLINSLGPENVYFSSYESGSWDNTKDVLWEMDAKLAAMGVARRILLDQRTHVEEVTSPPAGPTDGWIVTPRGKKELRRIPYLAKARNIVLEPLDDPRIRNATHGFDYVLFLNDVIFTPDEAIRLMRTNGGDYAAACSLDFGKPHKFYDTFALRAADGRPAVSLTYPYFGAGRSQDALLRGNIVPVQSCWNGMVSFNATPFTAAQTPLRFRSVPDSLALHHVEGSECCLIHADNPLAARRGVFLNPHVRVAYEKTAYDASRVWPTQKEALLAVPHRMWTGLMDWPWRERKISQRVKEWGGQEKGLHCLVDEMQVVAENGWAHV